MTLTITDRLICSPATDHTAKLIGQGDTAGWRVSWLPDRVLTQAEAEVAMNIAEALGARPAGCGPGVWNDGFWPRLQRWAAEFGLTADMAAALVTSMPYGEEITE